MVLVVRFQLPRVTSGARRRVVKYSQAAISRIGIIVFFKAYGYGLRSGGTYLVRGVPGITPAREEEAETYVSKCAPTIFLSM